jgi:hypothetical protein
MDIDLSLLSGPPLQQGIAAYSCNSHRGHKLVSRWPSVTPALKTNPPCRSLTALYLQAQCNQLLIAWRSRMKFPVAPFAYPSKLPTPTPDPTAVQAPTDGCVYFTCAFPIHSARPPSNSPPSQFKLHPWGWSALRGKSCHLQKLIHCPMLKHMTTLLGCRYDQSSHAENPCAGFEVIGAKLRGQWPSRHLPGILRIIWLHYDSKSSAEICAS